MSSSTVQVRKQWKELVLAGSHVPAQFSGVHRCKWAKCRQAYFFGSDLKCLFNLYSMQAAIWGRSRGIQAHQGCSSQTKPDFQAVWDFVTCEFCKFLYPGEEGFQGGLAEEVGWLSSYDEQEDAGGQLTSFSVFRKTYENTSQGTNCQLAEWKWRISLLINQSPIMHNIANYVSMWQLEQLT